jgi:hypothetical protein
VFVVTHDIDNILERGTHLIKELIVTYIPYVPSTAVTTLEGISHTDVASQHQHIRTGVLDMDFISELKV